MRVLTFGWEYPPTKLGGLGVACHGLVQELTKEGVEVILVLPRKQPTLGNERVIFADVLPAYHEVTERRDFVTPYSQSNECVQFYTRDGVRVAYTRTILQDVHRYAHVAAAIAKEEDFDVIHAHDWTSYLAGIAAKMVSGKPLVLHVHATSFDQAAGDNVDPEIYKIEKEAFAAADQVVTVSNFTRNLVIEKHGVQPEKVEAVHNGIPPSNPPQHEHVLSEYKKRGKKIILFHGRITVQKGIDYFIRAARRVVDTDQNVLFVVSGSGDMERQALHMVAEYGLSEYFIFAGALWDDDRDRMYQSADLYVMPSVSEPFGIVALEAIQHGTPVLISKQSGASEVLKHALKVDFWDTEEMANKMLAAVRYDVLNRQLVTEGKFEVVRLSWNAAAKKVITLYNRLRGLMGGK